MITIDKIEGNSKLGVPVFSQAGVKTNFKFRVFQPNYEEKKEILERNRQETQLQQNMRQYNKFQSNFTEESVKIKDKLRQIEEDINKRNTRQENNPMTCTNNKSNAQKNFVTSKERGKHDKGSYTSQRKQKSQPSPFFKAVTRDQFYNALSSISGEIPSVGSYNPKYSSIDKNSARVRMADTRKKGLTKADIYRSTQFKNYAICNKIIKAHNKDQLALNPSCSTSIAKINEQSKSNISMVSQSLNTQRPDLTKINDSRGASNINFKRTRTANTGGKKPRCRVDHLDLSPSHALIKKYPEMQIIEKDILRQRDSLNKTNKSVDFQRTISRDDYYRASNQLRQRTQQSPQFNTDQSKYNTSSSNKMGTQHCADHASIKAIDISKCLPREHNSTATRKTMKQRMTSQPKALIYHPNYKAVDCKYDKGTINFGESVSRDKHVSSIYRDVSAQNRAQSHDFSDLSNCYLKLSQNKKQQAPDFGRVKERDLAFMMKGSEMYNNILRDNERMQYLDTFRVKKQPSQARRNRPNTSDS